MKITKVKRNSNFFNYLAIYSLVALSGTLFLPAKDAIKVVLFALFLVIFLIRNLKIDKVFIIFMLYILIIAITQAVVFNSFDIVGIIGEFIALISAYIIIKIVGVKYTTYYINIMVFIAIISFCFYFPSVVSPSIHKSLASVADKWGTDAYLINNWGFHGKNFIFYTWDDWTPDGYLRNSGNFVEAGAFGSFLVIAFMLKTIEDKALFSFKNLIILAAIITTFSTACYISVLLFIFLWLSINMSLGRKIILYPIIIVFAIFVYLKLPFMNDKIQYQYETQKGGEANGGRFTSAILDYRDIYKYPLTGRGFTKETRADKIWEGGSNGLTGLAVVFSPLGFLIYFYLMNLSFRKYCKFHSVPANFSYMIIGVILSLSFAQYITLTPFLFSLVFMSALIPKIRYYAQSEIVRNHT